MSTPVSNWLPELLRVTFFYTTPPQVEMRPSLETTLGIESESTEIRGIEKSFAQVGSLGVGKIALGIQGPRLDWVWNIDSSTEDAAMSLGDVEASIDEFLKLLENWVKAQTNVSRIAMGGIFAIPADNRIDAYQKLQPYLHVLQLEPETTSELMYQINRFAIREFLGKQATFNRITKWGARAVRKGAFIFTSDGNLQSTNSEPVYSATCELDLSSPVDMSTPFGGEEAAKLLLDFKIDALEILETGDHA